MNYVQPSWDSPNHLQRDCNLRLSLKPEEQRFPLLLPLPRMLHSDASEGRCGRKFSPELKDKPVPTHLPTAPLIQLPQVHTQRHCPKHASPMHSQLGIPCTHAHPLLHTSHTSTSLLTLCLHPFLPPYLSPACTSEVCVNVCSMLSAGCLRGENNHHRIRQQSDLQAIPSFLQLFSAKQQPGGGAAKQGWGVRGQLVMACATGEHLWSRPEATKCVV